MIKPCIPFTSSFSSGEHKAQPRSALAKRLDENTRTLEIEFQGGRVYQYFDVPQPVFDGLLRADSHGTFFNSQIKGHYGYARV
ncbi:MAG: KTSC domain-containing protein [Syntrophorhabdales bacterium]|jgi:hypothetical protein